MTKRPRLSEQGQLALDQHLSEIIASGRYPAAFFGIGTADKIIYESQGGLLDMKSPGAGQVDSDTVLHLFSMTKLVTSVACLRLIDKGVLPKSSLDDSQFIEMYLPELGLLNLQVLEGYDGDKPILRSATQAITLRMLLNHTSGAAYPSRLTTPSPGRDLGIYARSVGKKHNSQSGATYSDVVLPLIFEPGSSFTYSLGLDHVGELMSRVTGKDLETIFQDEIFGPLGLRFLSFYPPTSTTKEPESFTTTAIPKQSNPSASVWPSTPTQPIRRASSRGALMKCTVWDPLTERPRVIDGPVWGKAINRRGVTLMAGGGGLYGTLRDYLKFLCAILKSGPDWRAHQMEGDEESKGEPLLSPWSYDLLFQPSLKLDNQKSALAGFIGRKGCDHSLGFVIEMRDQFEKRRKGSGWWYGAAQTHFWIDPKSGIAAVCGTQIVEAPMEVWADVYDKFERITYGNLKLE